MVTTGRFATPSEDKRNRRADMGDGRKQIAGIHHITGISGPPQENLAFYRDVLGLRFVKKTVNFDDPGTYHLYYGNDAGEPGTILTFFPWSNAFPGRAGVGMVTHTAFAVREESVGYWADRFADLGLEVQSKFVRFGSSVIRFAAPDGLQLELVGDPSLWRSDDGGSGEAVSDEAVSDQAVSHQAVSDQAVADEPSADSVAIPGEHTIRGFFGATLGVRDHERTARLLVDTFGYDIDEEEGARMRLTLDGNAPGRRIDLVVDPQGPRPRMGTGTIHHIAFRARDEEEQLSWREQIVRLGFNVTEVLDRNYFKSIYFREPNGVLFEIATDPPGFTADEPLETLGEALKLPAWLEPQRAQIERQLVPLS